MRARLAAHVQPPLGFTVVALELPPLERPVRGETVHRLQPEIFLREPVAGATPVQRQPAHRHGHRDDPVGLLIRDVVLRPRVFAVLHRALAVAAAILHVEDRAARFDDDDAQARTKLGELLRQHRGGDAAADDADVGFVNGH